MNQFEREFVLEHLLKYCSNIDEDNMQNLVEEKISVLRKMNIGPEDFQSRKGCIDLHIHTNISDGLFSPEDIFLAARYLGLTVISITDHATVAAYTQNPWIFKSEDCIILPGIEVHSLYNNKPYHILLFGEALLTSDFSKLIWKWQQKWNLRFHDICSMLMKKKSLYIDYEIIRKNATHETLDISDVANAVSELTGYSFNVVMEKYFGNKTAKGENVYIHAANPKYLPTIFEVAESAKKYGLHCVLAHPTKQQICELDILSAIQSGLTGIEVYHPTINKEFRAHLISLAKENGLKMFGGSDYHNPPKYKIQIGFYMKQNPSIRVPFAIFANSILNEPHIIVEGPLTLNKLTLEEKISLIIRPSFELMAFDSLSTNVIRQHLCTNSRIEKSYIDSSEKMIEYAQSCINANTHPIIINVNQEGGRLNTIDWFDNIFLSNSSVAKIPESKRKEQFSLLSRELELHGITWNLAPVCDLCENSMSKTGNRSFGNDLDVICQCINDFIEASKKSNVATTLKHFPGTGNCEEDCHWNLPKLSTIEKKHLAPFLFGMTHGADAIMISNAVISSLDKVPALLSPKVISDLLIDGIGAEQIIITDNLSMQSLLQIYENIIEVATLAVMAGSDFIMLNPDFSRGKNTPEERTLAIIQESKIRNSVYAQLLKSVRMGLIDESRIDCSVRKIISFYDKYAISSINSNWKNELISVQYKKEQFLKECASLLVKVKKDNRNLLPFSSSNLCIVVFSPSKGAKADSTWHRDVFLPEHLKLRAFHIDEFTHSVYDIIPHHQFDAIVYISYNIDTYPVQKEHICSLKDPYVIIGTGDDDEAIERLNVSCYISANERNTVFIQKAFSILLGE